MNACAACGLDVYDGGELCPICTADPPPGYGGNGQSAGVHVSTDKERTELQQAALLAIARHGGVVAAARALGCNHGVIALARDGKDFPKARKILGLPPKTVEVEPCADCGRVHKQLKTCDHKRTRKTPYRSLVFKFYDDAAFEAARTAVDSGGDRTEWLLSKIGDDNELD